jgi:hypothetical protein
MTDDVERSSHVTKRVRLENRIDYSLLITLIDKKITSITMVDSQKNAVLYELKPDDNTLGVFVLLIKQMIEDLEI